MITINSYLIIVCCVFRPAFGCCANPKAGWYTFCLLFFFVFFLMASGGLYSSIYVHFKHFSVIFLAEILKNVLILLRIICVPISSRVSSSNHRSSSWLFYDLNLFCPSIQGLESRLIKRNSRRDPDLPIFDINLRQQKQNFNFKAKSWFLDEGASWHSVVTL